MEAPFYQGINYRAGNPPYTPEKHGYKAGGGGCGDHFIVEDLLDFSNEDEDATGDLDCGSFEAVAGNSTDSSTVTAVDCCSNNSISGADHHFNNDLDLSGDLCEPYDELAELEWLSNFAEESFSSEDLEKLQLISGLKASTATSPETRVSSAAAAAAFRPDGPVPAKARSKRSRAAPCNWSSRLLVLSPPPIPSASSSSSDFIVPNSHKKLPKPSKKKDATIGAVMAPSEGRRCLHCAADKTPQWRTGPMGPKTLCNACGVRFKSGRLVPEYRPAASPTFMLSKHSNSHRKVLELRRQKEAVQHQQFLHPSMFDPAGDVLFNDFRQLI